MAILALCILALTACGPNNESFFNYDNRVIIAGNVSDSHKMPFYWSNSDGLNILPVPEGARGAATGITAIDGSIHVIGNYNDGGGNKASYWADGALMWGMPGGLSSEAVAIAVK